MRLIQKTIVIVSVNGVIINDKIGNEENIVK